MLADEEKRSSDGLDIVIKYDNGESIFSVTDKKKIGVQKSYTHTNHTHHYSHTIHISFTYTALAINLSYKNK